MNNLKLIIATDYLLLIDIDAEIRAGVCVVHGNTQLKLGWNYGCHMLEDDNEVKNYKEMQNLMRNFSSARTKSVMTEVVIAHLPLQQSPTLSGVMLLPELPGQDDVELLAKERYPMEFIGGGITKSDRQLQQNAFIAGHKVATKDRRWSDENIRNAMRAGNEYAFHEHLWKNAEGKSIVWTDYVDNFIQSLSPAALPVDFKPSYEDACCSNEVQAGMQSPDCCHNYITIFKTITTDKGLVLQGTYIY